MTAYRLVTSGSVEEKIRALAERKMELSKTIIKADGALAKSQLSLGHAGDVLSHTIHAGDLTDLLGELGFDIIVDLGQGQGVGCGAENEDRRIRRIDFPIARRSRKVFRQLPCRRIDGGLDIVGCRIDIAIEIELHGDAGGAERAHRCHLAHAGNLGDLRFERLSDRGSHGRGISAGETAPFQSGTEEPALKPGAVYKLQDGKPVRVQVLAGISDGAWTEVHSDALKPGDTVIVGMETPVATSNAMQPPPGMGGPRFGGGGRGGGGGRR